MTTRALSPAARDALAGATITGPNLVLPAQLDRRTYTEVNTALMRLGGVWARRVGAHVFSTDPTGRIAYVIETGLMPEDADKLASFWRTPRPVAELLVTEVAWSVADQVPSGAGRRILEPSAGDGAIARVIREAYPAAELVCIEPDEGRAATLHAAEFTTNEMTFQEYAAARRRPFDAVVMNPPFTEPGKPRAWVEHINLALDLLADGGTLAAVVPISYRESKTRAVLDLRARVSAVALRRALEPLPADAFRESGTSVRTAILTVSRPGHC